MTANQIAAQSERESERHNQISESEIERHNKESEQLERERNDITRNYNDRKLSLEEDYNKAYLEYLNAAEADKVAIENQLNWIKEQQMENDRIYKSEMTALGWSEQQVEAKYKSAMAGVAQFNAGIEAKRAYYEGQKTEAYMIDLEAQRVLAGRRLEQELLKIEHDYELGIISSEQRQQELNLARTKHTWEVSKWDRIGEEYAVNQNNLVIQQTKRTEAEIKETEASTSLKKKQAVNVGSETVRKWADTAASAVDAVMPF